MTIARSSRLLLAGTAGLLALGVAGADPVVRTSATVTAGVAYERNPFLIDTPRSTDAASAQIDLRPRVDIIDQRTQATIAAFYNRNQYFTKYHGNDGAGVSATGTSQLSTRWSVNGSAAFESTVLGANNGFGAFQDALTTLPPATTPVGDTGTDTGVTAPVTTVPGAGVGGVTGPVATLPGIDVGLIGLRQRRNSLTSSIGTAYTPDSRSTFSLSGFAEKSWYPDDRIIQAQNYRTLGGTFGYNRRLSETTTVGARVSASFTKYDFGQNSKIYSPQATFTRVLPHNWTIDLAVGASIVDTSGNVIGPGLGNLVSDTNGTTVNAQGSLCHASIRESFCLSAARSPSVSGFAGVNIATSVTASYTRKLDERSTFAASASYSRNNYGDAGSFVDVVPLNNAEYWSATLSYSHRLTERVSAVGTAGYRNVNYDNAGVNALNGGDPRSDISGRLGLSVALGRLQ